ncbi:hypothetical protein [Neorhizobium galegae]|uniref:Uncharacterized protein n=1 Tax=Neorhizobium galegae bv. officinalis TaxID=323656 RepID=A0A0T7GWF6_NEOGA|nr:hypothetical protein [Neorhizobium galegae]CDZ51624.1 Hypothetical protein NGAL_HAMBI1189_40740 [Neorhizobium galegae bv. officinalis]
MSHLCTVVAATAIVASGVQAQEREPFHIVQFSDSQTVSLTITSLVASADTEYNFDVGISLTEHSSSGEAVFVDDSSHAVRVRCEAPRVVKVGGTVHILPNLSQTTDWKDDLWKTLCLQPVS